MLMAPACPRIAPGAREPSPGHPGSGAAAIRDGSEYGRQPLGGPRPTPRQRGFGRDDENNRGCLSPLALRPLGERLGARLEVRLALEARLGRERLLVVPVLEARLLAETAFARRCIRAGRIGLLLEGAFAIRAAGRVAVRAPRLLLERRAALAILVAAEGLLGVGASVAVPFSIAVARALHRPGRRRLGRCDAGLFLAHLSQAGEGVGVAQGDLEARFLRVGADRADLLLGHAADAADQRDQPFRVGVAVAADVQAEPADLVRLQAVARPGGRGVVVAARRIAFTARLALRAFARIAQVFRRRQVLAQQHQQGAGQIVRRALLDQRLDQARILVRAFLGEDGRGQQALFVLTADLLGGRRAGPDGLDPSRTQ